MKITKVQRLTLEQLKYTDEFPNHWRSAFDLRVGLNTLGSLEMKRMVECKEELGSMFSPRTNLQWRITDKGRKALTEAE